MVRSLIAAALAAGLSLVTSLSASAALIIDTSSPYAVAGQIGDFGNPGHDLVNDNDALIKNPQYGAGTILNGWFGANLTVSKNTTLVFEFLGKEASYLNSINAPMSGLTLKNTAKIGSSFQVYNLAGLVDFAFSVDKTPKNNVANADLVVKNGENNNHLVARKADFWMGYDPKYPHSVLVALDDGGMKPSENDHDDMLVRIRAISVPEPASLALFGLGLVGLGLRRRNKS